MRRYLKYFLLTVIIVFIFTPWFFTKTPNIGNDLSYDFVPIYEGFPLPWSWTPLVGQGFGMYTLGTSWTYPVQIFFQLLLKFNVPFWFQMKYFAVLPIVLLSSFGLYKLSKLYKIDWFVPIILYLTNTYFLLLVDGGQLNLGLAYSILPLSFYLFRKAIVGNLVSKIQFSLSVWIIGAFDMRIVFILALLLGVHFLFEIKSFGNYLSVLLLTVITLTLLNAYWILPSAISKGVSLPKGYGSVTQLEKLNFTTLPHSFFLQQPHWYKNVFGKTTNPIWYFVPIPLFAFYSILKGKQNKNLLYFAAISVVGIFLTKGVNGPMGFLYSWIFENIPGFNLFRDSSKFFFIIAFSYSILFGFSVNVAVRYINRILLYFLITIYLLVIANPVYTGKMTGTFSKPSFINEITTTSKIISNDQNFGRILWLPTKLGLGYYSPSHPAVDGFALLERRPFSIGTVGTYELFNFLRESPFMGQLFSIAGIKYIYYPYPDTRWQDLKKDNIDYYFMFLDQLSNLPWIEKRISDPPIAVLQTKNTQDHIYLANNSFYVVGSDRLYWELMDIPDFDLSKNVLIYSEESPGSMKTIDESSSIILYNKSETDLLMSFADIKSFYFPAKDLSREPSDNNSGLWKREASDMIWWRDFLQTKYNIDNLDFDYGGGYAIAEGNLQLAINSKQITLNNKQETKDQILFARVMTSLRGGKVEFWQDGTKIGEINTLVDNPDKVDVKLTGYKEVPDKNIEYNKADFNWYEIGKIPQENKQSLTVFNGKQESVKSKQLTIKTFGDINVINAIITLSNADVDELQDRVDGLKEEGRVIVVKRPSHEATTGSGTRKDSESNKQEAINYKKSLTVFNDKQKADVTYKRINPTKYKVEITGLTKPEYLIFSETFDEMWELNGQPAKQVYSFVNGFYVEKDGKYTLYFTPQKYVYPGLVISGVTLTVILGILLYPKLRKKI